MRRFGRRVVKRWRRSIQIRVVSSTLIVSALVQTVLSTMFAVLVARVYAQLAGDGQARVFA